MIKRAKPTKKAPARAPAAPQRTVGDLKPADYNPRAITPDQLERLGKSMEEFGDLGGVVFNVATGRLVGGHQRLKKLQPEWPVTITERVQPGKGGRPFLDSTGTVALGYIEAGNGRIAYREVAWDEKKEKAANIAANHHGGDDDLPKLKEIVADLDDGSTDMDLLGFSEDELADLFGKEPPEDEAGSGVDAAPPARDEAPVARDGQVWRLDGHRLLVGQPQLIEQVRALFGPEQAQVVFTDAQAAGASLDDLAQALGVLGRDFLPDDAAYYLWHSEVDRTEAVQAAHTGGLTVRRVLVWVKGGGSGKGYAEAHQPCLYAARAGQDPAWHGQGDLASSVWRVALSASKDLVSDLGPGVVVTDGHGGKVLVSPRLTRTKKLRTVTVERGAALLRSDLGPSTVWEVAAMPDLDLGAGAKPAALAARACEHSSAEGAVLYDPFLGRGDSLMGAEVARRRCFGVVRTPQEADAVIARWQAFTGKTAELEQAL